MSGIIRTSSGDSSGIRRTSLSTRHTASGDAAMVVSARSSRSAALVTAAVWQPGPSSATLCAVLIPRLRRALVAPLVAAGLVLALAGPAHAADTEILTGPADGAVLLPGPVTYTFTANDGGYTFECSVDGAPFTSCPNGQSATYDLPPGGHIFRVRYVGLGTDDTPAQRTWTIRNVPCEQAGAAYKAAQGELVLQEAKLAKAKTKLHKAKAKDQAGKVKRLKKKVKKIKQARDAAQAAAAAAAAQEHAVC